MIALLTPRPLKSSGGCWAGWLVIAVCLVAVMVASAVAFMIVAR